jgi:hypothetical protein
LLSPHSESSGPGTILYLSEDAPPDFLSGFAEDNGIRIGTPHVCKAARNRLRLFVQRRCLLPVAPGVQENSPSLVKARYYFEHFSHTHLARVDACWQALHVMHRLLESQLYPTLLMDAAAGHRVGAVVGCLRKLQNWCTSAILDEYRRYAGNKARDNVEHFMELFDTDLVHVSVRPPWLYVALLNNLCFSTCNTLLMFCQVRVS